MQIQTANQKNDVMGSEGGAQQSSGVGNFLCHKWGIFIDNNNSYILISIGK